MEEITKDHTTNTPYHIFVLYKMASVNNMAGDTEKNEEVFERIVETAPMAYPDNDTMIFRCHNTLLKYYLNFDVDKCCKHGKDALSDKFFEYAKLSKPEQYDLQHTVGTAYSLEGTSHEDSFKCYKAAVRAADEYNKTAQDPTHRIAKGYALNNMGMGKFWYFMEKSKEVSQSGIEDREKIETELKPYVTVFEQVSYSKSHSDHFS